MKVIVHTDGGSRGNPGPAAAGVVIQCAETHAPLYEAGHFLSTMTNNAAEYRGLILALEAATKLGADDLDIRSDSQLMVRQILGQYKVKSADLAPLFRQARTLLGRFKHWQIRHVYRESNDRADALANLAMDGRKDVVVQQPQDWAPTHHDAPAPPGNPGHTRSQPDRAPATDRGDLFSPQAPRPAGRARSRTEWWRIEFMGQPVTPCPGGAYHGLQFDFGPQTPPGCCIYAAAAVLSTCSAPQADMNKPQQLVTCALCKARIQVRPRRGS